MKKHCFRKIRGKAFKVQRKVITEAKQEMAKSEKKKSIVVRKFTTWKSTT